MFTTILSKLSSFGSSTLLPKILFGVCIALASMLAGSLYLLDKTNDSFIEQSSVLTEVRLVNVGLNNVISQLETELKDRPKEYIEITKDVYTELCQGQVLGESILTLPPLKVQAKSAQEIGANDEKDVYVDRDGLLDPDLKRLLQ